MSDGIKILKENNLVLMLCHKVYVVYNLLSLSAFCTSKWENIARFISDINNNPS